MSISNLLVPNNYEIYANEIITDENINCNNLTATGTVSGNNLAATSTVSGTALNISGASTTGSLTSFGTINGSSAGIFLGTVSAGNFNTSGNTITNTFQATSLPAGNRMVSFNNGILTDVGPIVDGATYTPTAANFNNVANITVGNGIYSRFGKLVVGGFAITGGLTGAAIARSSFSVTIPINQTSPTLWIGGSVRLFNSTTGRELSAKGVSDFSLATDNLLSISFNTLTGETLDSFTGSATFMYYLP